MCRFFFSFAFLGHGGHGICLYLLFICTFVLFIHTMHVSSLYFLSIGIYSIVVGEKKGKEGNGMFIAFAFAFVWLLYLVLLDIF